MPTYEAAKAIFEEQGLSISRETFSKFEIYAKFLLERNRVVNLTAVTAPEAIFEKHFLDSLLPLARAPECFPKDAALLDLGSGAGFPGVPLGLAREDMALTLLDSQKKRTDFLEELTRRLSLPAKILHARAEETAKAPLRENFEIVTARAVAALPVLCEYALPFVKIGGYFLAMKGPGEPLEPALPAIKCLGGAVKDIRRYALPSGDARVLYLIEKRAITPPEFPRRAKKIQSQPLT